MGKAGEAVKAATLNGLVSGPAAPYIFWLVGL